MHPDTKCRHITQIINRYTGFADVSEHQAAAVHNQVRRALAHDEYHLTLALPAFPFRSTNHADKVAGNMPDYGEKVALATLHSLCHEISTIVPVQLMIVSDGHVFNDLLGVSDREVDDYFDVLEKMNASPHISFRRLKHLMGDHPVDQLRRVLVDAYADPIDTVSRQLAEQDTALYCGMKRFMGEERPQIKGEPQSQFNARCGILAKKMYQRSQAYSRLMEQKLPHVVRLTIHPRDDWRQKIPVRLVPSADRWATPWHNVAVWDETASAVMLMHKKDAEKRGYIPEISCGKIWRYVPRR